MAKRNLEFAGQGKISTSRKGKRPVVVPKIRPEDLMKPVWERSTAPKGPLRTLHCTCQPDDTAFLLDELAAVFPHSIHRQCRTPGLVSSTLSEHDLSVVPTLAFARQVVPDGRAFNETGSGKVSSFACKRMSERPQLTSGSDPWRLHTFTPDAPIFPRVVQARGRPKLQQDLLSVCSSTPTASSLVRRFNRKTCSTVWGPSEWLVQILFTNLRQGVVSVVDSATRHRFRRVLSPFCAGMARLPKMRDGDALPDRADGLEPTPPSSAFKKLLEVEMRLGKFIEQGEAVVDLGSCPGGWSWLALSRGAIVTSVDLSPLREDLLRHPNMTFFGRDSDFGGDAFQFKPSKGQKFDWALCDMAVPPTRTLELLRKWIVVNKRCKRFCFTLKFTGSSDYASVLRAAKDLLEKSGAEFFVRRLDSGGNEVTLFGELPAKKLAAKKVEV